MAWKIFNRAAQKPPESPADVLRARFKTATQEAVPLRTRAFAAPDGVQTLWQEALPAAGGAWRLVQKTLFMQPAPGVRQETLLGGKTVDFIGMVEALAAFDSGQAGQGHAAVKDENNPAAMEGVYFKPFAEDEAVAFDSNGQPHVTEEDGVIPGDGLYPPEAYAKARAAAARKKASVKLPGMAMPVLTLENGEAVPLDRLTACDAALLALHDFRDFVKETTASAEKQGNSWLRAAPHLSAAELQDKSASRMNRMYAKLAAVNRSLEPFMAQLANFGSGEAEHLRLEIVRAKTLLDFDTNLSVARELFRLQDQTVSFKTPGGTNWVQDPKWMAESVMLRKKDLVKKLETLGQNQKESSEIFIERLVRDCGGKTVYPAEIDPIVEWLEKTIDVLRKGAFLPKALPLPAVTTSAPPGPG